MVVAHDKGGMREGRGGGWRRGDGLERGISERQFRFVKQFRRVSSDNVRGLWASLITNEFIRARVYAVEPAARIIYKEGRGHARRYRNTPTPSRFRRFKKKKEYAEEPRLCSV